MNKRDIKDVLKELIERRDLNQTRLADESGVPQPTISRILKGTHQTLELETARRLADYFEVSIDQLVGDEPLSDDHQWFAIKKVWQRLPAYKRTVVETTARALDEAPQDGDHVPPRPRWESDLQSRKSRQKLKRDTK